MSEEETPRIDTPDQPRRLTRETLLGCLGLFCVLLTVPLLWLAAESGANWIGRALPLLAFTAAVGGAALALRVPSPGAVKSFDPLHPLTHSGGAPTREQPATTANRVALGLVVALTLAAVAGYTVELTQPSASWGLELMGVAGAALVALGGLVALGYAPAPALRWQRVSIYGGLGRQTAPLFAIGLVALCGALFLALLDGYVWGPIGVALLIVAAVMLAPLARRAPTHPYIQRSREPHPHRSNDTNGASN
jgi:hypothetical protein